MQKRRLTEKQEAFLEAYSQTNSVTEALYESGLTKGNFNRDVMKDSVFALAFHTMMDDSLKRYGLSKIKSLSILEKIRDEAANNPETYGVAITAIKLMASMSEGHMAVQKKLEERKIVNVNAVIDFTKPKEIEQTTEDISYEIAEEEDGD